jgi:hypothetical protein
MNSVLSFLGARLAERSTRVQLATLAGVGLVATGLVSTDQVSHFASTAMQILGVVSPVVAIFTADPKATVPAEAVANAALAAAQAAAAKVPGADLVQHEVEQVAAAAEDAINKALGAGA